MHLPAVEIYFTNNPPNETDAAFFQRVATDYGWITAVDSDGIAAHIGPRHLTDCLRRLAEYGPAFNEETVAVGIDSPSDRIIERYMATLPADLVQQFDFFPL